MAQFGPFELDRLLGRGGMAEAFSGFRVDDPNREPLVLKRIRPDLAASDEYFRRFVLEAQVASRLNHPNLVAFREYGRVGDCHYIAMTHVRGYSLQRLLSQSMDIDARPAPEAALFLGVGIFDGLAAMHSVVDQHGRPRPMLHRDVTPNNVIITHDGDPVIIDFGITKDVHGPQITLPGRVIGTARYMAPEHRKAEFIDPRADVFSASYILYELLTGVHPWPPMKGVKELLRVTFDPPRLPEELAPTVPRDALAVLLRGLECDPDARPGDAREMSEALKRCAAFQNVEQKGPAAVRAWIKKLGVTSDESLGEPVVDNLADDDEAAEVMWTATGSLATVNEPSEDETIKMQAINAHVLTIPPLPPRRDAVLETARTEDLRREVAGGKQRWVIMVGAVICVLFLGLAFLLLKG